MCLCTILVKKYIQVKEYVCMSGYFSNKKEEKKKKKNTELEKRRMKGL